MIRLNNLSKYFYRHKKNEIHVINNTSLEFGDKGLVALLGPSGCGKTTLLNCIGGLDKPNSGSIEINGIKITKNNFYKMDKIRNLNIGYIFQDYKLIDDLSVFDNVAISLRMCGIKDKDEIKRRVDNILNIVELYRYRKRPASSLSGGERQRVGIARALVKNPSVVICDEPTGNLDSRNSIEIMNIIKSISRDKLVILVTHETSLANLYADRIISIEDGKITGIKDNDSHQEIDYEIDGKIYLKDLENHNEIKKDNIEINFYSDSNKKVKINLVYKNNKLYIESKEEIEKVSDDTPFELVNSHYKKMDKSVYEKYNFEIEDIPNKKYASLYNIINMLYIGFIKVKNYSKIRRLSLLSFYIAGALLLYSISSYFAATKVYNQDFNFDDNTYIKVTDKNVTKYEKELLELDEVDYILPGKMHSVFSIPVKEFFQTTTFNQGFSATYGSAENLKADELLYGRLPNEHEVVVDKGVYDQIQESVMEYNHLSLIGVEDIKDLIGKEIVLSLNCKYKIVGISNTEVPEVYMNKNDIERAALDDPSGDPVTNYGFKDIYFVSDDITIVEGRTPDKDEVIINEKYKSLHPLNQKSNISLGSKSLTVVGYYKSEDVDNNLVNVDTIREFAFKQTMDFIISSQDKEKTIKKLRELKITGEDLYHDNYTNYINNRKQSNNAKLAAALVIFAITLVEIFFVIRASFQSRIKEIGILRAIGVKRSDIYKMFAGEIIISTTLAGISGVLLTYIFLYALNDIKVVSRMLSMNPMTIVLASLILYVFNVIVGLLPVWLTVRSTPAHILSRKDI